jgi:hypothetical protein
MYTKRIRDEFKCQNRIHNKCSKPVGSTGALLTHYSPQSFEYAKDFTPESQGYSQMKRKGGVEGEEPVERELRETE